MPDTTPAVEVDRVIPPSGLVLVPGQVVGANTRALKAVPPNNDPALERGDDPQLNQCRVG